MGQAGWRREPDHAVDDAKNGWKRNFLCGDCFGFRVFERLDATFRTIHVNPSGTASTLTLYAEVPSSSTASYYIDDVQLTGGIIVSNQPISGASIVDWNNVHQRIDGFGASSAYNGTWSTAEADLLFSTNNNITYQSATYNGIGLSLLRNHIIWANTTSASDTPSTAETAIMKLAQACGARVSSTHGLRQSGSKAPMIFMTVCRSLIQ